jgi:serine/threonine-protein kinase
MIGSRLGKWVVDKELGRGGMGRVYLAHAEPDGQQAALKVLAPELAQEGGFLQRFQREIEALRQLEHPNIVQFYESGTHDGTFFFAMEYIEGQSFEDLLRQRGCWPWQEVLEAALHICPALKHAHDRGIIHRDIKPPNLIRSGSGVIKLTDFGIAKVFAGRHLTNTGGVVGTAEYLSPEQATGKPATKRSDLYSLGVVFYTLLTGRTPFEGHTVPDLLHKHVYGQFDRPRALAPQIPHELDEIICQLLEKDPARRPADASVLHRQFERLARKLAYRSQPTVAEGQADRTLVQNKTVDSQQDNPGPATLMSQLVRQELGRANQGNPLSQWINRPTVLGGLLFICVGLIILKFWPTPIPTAESLFQSAKPLMESDDPTNWDKAWNEYLQPLQRHHPEHPYQEQLAEFRQKREDHLSLRRALANIRDTGPVSEAQRFYLRGLRFCQEGDVNSANELWQNVVVVFGGIESEQRWVQLARQGIAGLALKGTSNETQEQTLQRVLKQMPQGDVERQQFMRAFKSLYGNSHSLEKP